MRLKQFHNQAEQVKDGDDFDLVFAFQAPSVHSPLG